MTDSSPEAWKIRAGLSLVLDHPRVMGIINTTPDSFHDGGAALDPQDAARTALDMQARGAHVLDIGGASTRPGAAPVDDATQIERTVPAIRAIRDAGVALPVTVDTTRAGVARAALDAGADAINDVSGGKDDPEILALAAERKCGLILMHRLTRPERDRFADNYPDEPGYEGGVVDAVVGWLAGARDAAVKAGVEPACIVLDPGLGFGKSVDQCVALHRATDRLLALGHPVLGAISRKSFVGRVSLERDSASDERLAGTIAWTMAQFDRGIRLVRVHDVEAATAAARVWTRLRVAEAGLARL